MNKITLNRSRIFVGDVLEILRFLPDASIDLVVTSPPYNKRNRTHGWLVTNRKYSHYDDHMSEDLYQDWQVNILNELYRVIKPGGSLFYNHKHRWEDGVFINPYAWISKTDWTLKQEIVWDRSIAANMRGWRFWQVDERIYWLYKPNDNYLIGDELESRHAKFSSIWRIKPEPRTEAHPAPFPVELPARIIYSILNSKLGTVLDPFCGSGTTLVAAKILGHKYFGIDVSPEYATYARKRLNDFKSEKLRVEEEKKRHVIDESFAERKKGGKESWPYGPKPPKKSIRNTKKKSTKKKKND